MLYIILFFMFLMGICIGSFLNVLIYRLPRKEEIVIKGSHCTSCGESIKFYDLVPLFSYLFLGGKCRYCKQKISIQYPLVEFFTGIVFAVVTFFLLKGVNNMPDVKMAFELITLLVFLCICIPTFLIDLKHYIIPNGIIIFGAISGILLKICQSILLNDWGILLNSVLGMGIGLVIFILIMVVGQFFMKSEVMGMGDVKLIGVVGLFLGFKLTLVTIFFAYIIGAIASIFLLITKKKSKKDIIPFGPFIILGAVVAITYGQVIVNWYLEPFLRVAHIL